MDNSLALSLLWWIGQIVVGLYAVEYFFRSMAHLSHLQYRYALRLRVNYPLLFPIFLTWGIFLLLVVVFILGIIYR